MKKLKIILIIAATILSNLCSAQNWAPDGAEWYYSFASFWNEGYVHIYTSGDTLINDISCRKLDREYVIHNHNTGVTTTSYIGREYMYYDEDKVYIYVNDQFYTLYDFSANVGDSWIIPENEDLNGPDDMFDPEGEIVVIETGVETINGQELRKIVVKETDESHWGLGRTIIEKIGPMGYMLPEPTPNTGVADVYEGGPLRCYSDNEFGNYSTGIVEECDFVVSVETNKESLFEIYPNPCEDILNVKFPETMKNCNIGIFDMSGREIKKLKANGASTQINTSDLKTGMYRINLKTASTNSNHLIIKK